MSTEPRKSTEVTFYLAMAAVALAFASVAGYGYLKIEEIHRHTAPIEKKIVFDSRPENASRVARFAESGW